MEFTNKFELIEGQNIFLKIIEKYPGDDKVIPFYYYDIYHKTSNKQIGKISIRIGSNYHSYYNGHIGYEINEAARGHHFSLEASILVIQVAKYHKMDYVYLTCNDTNLASIKIIEALGATLIETLIPPKDYFGFYEGMEKQRIYKLIL